MRIWGVKARALATMGLTFGANAAVWAAALLVFRGHLNLVELGAMAYLLGLAHALDADHICAIDNVTRKLMQEGQRPTMVGFFFSVGHSTVVLCSQSPSPWQRPAFNRISGHWQTPVALSAR